MSKIVINTTGSNVLVNDTGVTILASSSYTIQQQDYLLWAASSDIIVLIGNGTVIINDGSFDLSISAGVDLIKGIFPSSVSITGEATVVLNDEDMGDRFSDSDTLQCILTELKILNKAIALSLLNGSEIGEEDV